MFHLIPWCVRTLKGIGTTSNKQQSRFKDLIPGQNEYWILDSVIDSLKKLITFINISLHWVPPFYWTLSIYHLLVFIFYKLDSFVCKVRSCFLFNSGYMLQGRCRKCRQLGRRQPPMCRHLPTNSAHFSLLMTASFSESDTKVCNGLHELKQYCVLIAGRNAYHDSRRGYRSSCFIFCFVLCYFLSLLVVVHLCSSSSSSSNNKVFWW